MDWWRLQTQGHSSNIMVIKKKLEKIIISGVVLMSCKRKKKEDETGFEKRANFQNFD